jgi:predicted AAA+ superfamily ATPase
MYPRFLESIAREVLVISPAVLIAGPRQVGKSTLSMKLMPEYVLLDDVAIRNSAIEDPAGFLNTQKKPLCLDEIQKVPQLLEAIKIAIDKNRVNGDFLLTGSASLLDMKGVGDTLAGRLINLTMWPLSVRERGDKTDNLINTLLDRDFEKNISAVVLPKITHDELIHMILTGGYPEAIKIENPKMRSYWYASYISTYIERDVRDIGEIRNLNNFIKLFNLLAPRSANIFNIKALSKDSAMTEATVKNYLSLLKLVFQIQELLPYSANISKRFIKSSKFYFTDTGTLAHLLNVYTVEDLYNSPQKGLIFETFVFTELLKHISYTDHNVKLYHYRTADQKEIDFIIEYGQKIFAIEVKASSKVEASAFKHIVDLQKRTNKVKLGIVFYMGDTILPFGKNMYAIPISFLF